MKRFLSVAALPLFLFPFTGCAHPAPPPYYAPPPPGAIASQGFNDGVNAARRDMANRLPPHAERHPRFRNPPVPPGEPSNIYRMNFRRGYRQTYRSGY